jgi:serine/threonine protein kinase
MSAPSPSDPNTLDLPPSQEEVTRQFPADAATIHPDARPVAPPAQVPGYEILEELGRGGMGVVYKARHLKLNRVVALKMILSGGHAGEAERGRFLTEAQSIARLQHPNVVQVFEVGECEGRPFFSMEFCAGGSLEKRLAGTPLPPREAAGLVATLARAMQAAHGHGIVHRDLKPANVLLQRTADSQKRGSPGRLCRAVR